MRRKAGTMDGVEKRKGTRARRNLLLGVGLEACFDPKNGRLFEPTSRNIHKILKK